MPQKRTWYCFRWHRKSATVQIGQSETSARVSKLDSVKSLADALHYNYINFCDGAELSKAEQIMMNFFWLEESVNGLLYIFQLQKYNDKADKRMDPDS